MKVITLIVAFALFFSVFLFSSVFAGEVTIPHTFQSGNTAVASEVNANFSALETEVNDNASAITANSANIGANTTDITANVADIAVNTTEIADNGDRIASNTDMITTNTDGISANSTHISANVSAIASNADDIAGNTGDIDKNASMISTNATAIDDNTADIESLLQTKTGNFSLNFASISMSLINGFQGRWDQYAGLYFDSGSHYFDFAIDVPHGAEIAEFMVNAYDIQDEEEIRIFLYENELGSSYLGTEIASVSSTGTPGSVTLTHTLSSPHQVDKSLYAYSGRIYFGSSASFSDPRLGFKSLRITYTVDP